MPLYKDTPVDNKDLHHQTKQSDITEEEYFDLFAVPVLKNKFLVFLRFLSFIVFFGPIRFILCIASVLIYYLMTIILPYFKFLFKTEKEFKLAAHKIIRPIVRQALFFAGIVWINKTGDIDPEARVFVGNHLTLIDILNVLYWVPFTIMGHIGLKDNSFIKNTANVFNVIFVNRSKKQNATQALTDAANDMDNLPLVVFPEGKVSNGETVLAFRTGAFVSGQPVQPFSLRYRSWFIFDGEMTPAWLDYNFLNYCYQLWCCPFLTLDIHFLPTIKNDGNSTPAERAVAAQLAIANDLGVKAINKSNKDFFKVKKE